MYGDIAVVTYNDVMLLEVVLFKPFSMDKSLFTGFLLVNEPPLAVMFIMSDVADFSCCNFYCSHLLCTSVFTFVCTKIFMKFYIKIRGVRHLLKSCTRF